MYVLKSVTTWPHPKTGETITHVSYFKEITTIVMPMAHMVSKPEEAMQFLTRGGASNYKKKYRLSPRYTVEKLKTEEA